ncbi:hypothetical protein HY003_01435 [Candidatus Saccharibacteria bacterium]|nr:hypothetical protein [Candidatus Saccharibacteria bacterium]MBI3337940.1 hypothetical protein [Candidatus Saccharibacteria bacterium]
MTKKSKKATGKTEKKLITTAVLIVIAVLVVIGTVLGIYKVRYYNDAASQAGLVQIRELILLAVRGLKKDAPVEPRTGDIYFPESKLYLPNPGVALPLTYLYDKGDITNSQGELSISTYPVRGTEALYTARTQASLFATVPKLQACSRGIKLVHNQFPASDVDNELKHKVQLNNGQTLYLYLEKACPELSETADLFKSIQSY